MNKKKDKYKRWKKEHEVSEGRSRRREPSPRRINFDTDEEAEEEDDREDGEDHDDGENQDDSEDRRNTDDRDRENNEEDREDEDELCEGSLSIFDRMGRRLTLRDLRHRMDDRHRRMQERLEREGSRSRESRGSRGHRNHRRRRPPSPPSGSSGDGSSYSSSEESHAPRRRRPPRHKRDELEEFSDGENGRYRVDDLRRALERMKGTKECNMISRLHLRSLGGFEILLYPKAIEVLKTSNLMEPPTL